MRLLLTFALLTCVVPHPVHAQTLDIGGIAVRIGERPEDALRSLASYQVHYDDGSWDVLQKAGEVWQLLGFFSAADDSIRLIDKSFPVRSEGDMPRIYTEASAELHRLGGETCMTTEMTVSDNLIHGFETQCGRYTLTYSMAWESSEGKSSASVDLQVR